MNARIPLTLFLASAFALCVGSAAAQTGGSTAGSNATPTPSAGTGDTAPTDTTGSEKSGKHHAHHAHHASHHHAGHDVHTAGFIGHQETPYQRDLRRCAAGPASDRDRCLDDAIARNSG
jgi:hypothetical protein